MAQEAKRDQITDRIVWQMHIEDEPEGGGSHGRSAGLCSGCQLRASTVLLGRPGLRIFDVALCTRPTNRDPRCDSFDTKCAMRASPLASTFLLSQRKQKQPH